MNHARRHKREESPPNRWGGYVGIPLVIVATLVLAPSIYHRWCLPDSSWPSFPARVVATRVVSTGTVDNPWGTSFMYRAEVNAIWTENGAEREAWAPTTKIGRDKAWLAMWASQQRPLCTVRRSPRNPSALIAFF